MPTTSKCKEVIWPNTNPVLIKSGLGWEERGWYLLLSLLDRRWTWQALTCENVQEYYQMSSQNTCRGQDLIHLLLMVGELSNCRERSMLQKQLIDPCVYQRELGGHLSCLRHRALQVWHDEDHVWSQDRTQIPGCRWCHVLWASG